MDTDPSSAQTALPSPPEPFVRVLHVNDSTDDQVLFQAACRSAKVPLNWHVADSAGKGISYLRTLIEQSPKNLPVCWPSLVLLDVVMPEQSGFEVLKYIRQTPELKHLPVVVFSGYPKTEAESLQLGADHFWTKPPGFEEAVALARKLYELLKQYQGTGGIGDRAE